MGLCYFSRMKYRIKNTGPEPLQVRLVGGELIEIPLGVEIEVTGEVQVFGPPLILVADYLTDEYAWSGRGFDATEN